MRRTWARNLKGRSETAKTKMPVVMMATTGFGTVP